MTSTIEERPNGWFVTNVRDAQGRLVSVGPFSTASKAAMWAMLHIGAPQR